MDSTSPLKTVCALKKKLDDILKREMTNKRIAELFSGGQFGVTYPYLSENIEWNIFGEKILQGKKAVVGHCDQTAQYFRSVTIDFRTYNVIAEANRIAIHGRAEFIRDGKTVALVNACDVYEFDDSGILQKIYSYCINENKQK